MTIAQTIEASRIMDAFINGKEVESKSIVNNYWVLDKYPSWNWLNYDYRIKPTTVLRPWTADEVPLGAWMRSKKSNGPRFLLSSTRNDAYRIELMSDHEHSTDGGKTWLPCGVVEDKL